MVHKVENELGEAELSDGRVEHDPNERLMQVLLAGEFGVVFEFWGLNLGYLRAISRNCGSRGSSLSARP